MRSQSVETMADSWRARAGTTFETSKREVVASEAVVASNHPLACSTAPPAGAPTARRWG